MNDCLKNKIEFIEKINKAIDGEILHIDNIKYEVFQVGKWYDEYLVITYKGGCIQARNCSGNSNEANFEEIANMLWSSQKYPRDTKAYKELKSNN